MFDLSIPELAKIVPAVLVGLTIHEFAHSLVAIKLGDDTPKKLGRLTLNPIKHIDPIGFILLLIAGFGWAKPVRINKENLKHPFRDDVIISLLGPFTNLIFAFLLTMFLWLVLTLVPFTSAETLQTVFSTFIVFIWINIGLGIFNLLPIPPLDGSHLITNLISTQSYSAAAAYFKYGSFLLLVIIVIDRVTEVDLFPIGRVIDAIITLFLRIFSII